MGSEVWAAVMGGLRVVLLAVLASCVQGLGLKATQAYDNYGPAYMLSTLPSMFHTQMQQRMLSPQGTHAGNVYPFTTHDNDFSETYGVGMNSNYASAQWDPTATTEIKDADGKMVKEKGAFRYTGRMYSPKSKSMSLKRFFQSTRLPISGTFMPLDLNHA